MGEKKIAMIAGTYDHIDQVLSKVGLKWTNINIHTLDNSAGLGDFNVLIVNCGTNNISAQAKENLRKFVSNGGILITTDWALASVTQIAFPEYIMDSGQRTGNDQVPVEIAMPDHPMIKNIKFAPNLKWWLEGSSFPIKVINENMVRKLIVSKELQNRFGHDGVVVTFNFGKGHVIHAISHFYQQQGTAEAMFSNEGLLKSAIKADEAAIELIYSWILKHGGNADYVNVDEICKDLAYTHELVIASIQVIKERFPPMGPSKGYNFSFHITADCPKEWVAGDPGLIQVSMENVGSNQEIIDTFLKIDKDEAHDAFAIPPGKKEILEKKFVPMEKKDFNLEITVKERKKGTVIFSKSFKDLKVIKSAELKKDSISLKLTKKIPLVLTSGIDFNFSITLENKEESRFEFDLDFNVIKKGTSTKIKSTKIILDPKAILEVPLLLKIEKEMEKIVIIIMQNAKNITQLENPIKVQ